MYRSVVYIFIIAPCKCIYFINRGRGSLFCLGGGRSANRPAGLPGPGRPRASHLLTAFPLFVRIFCYFPLCSRHNTDSVKKSSGFSLQVLSHEYIKCIYISTDPILYLYIRLIRQCCVSMSFRYCFRCFVLFLCSVLNR